MGFGTEIEYTKGEEYFGWEAVCRSGISGCQNEAYAIRLRHAVAYLVETICYKLEGRRFDEVIGYFN
jgi:hypothetical protein